MLLYIAVAAASALLWVYMTWSKVARYWADRGVPFDPPHPLYGSLTFLHKENPGIYMRRLYERFRVPVVGIWLFWRPALVINDKDLGRKILVNDFDNFRNRLTGSGSAPTDPVGGLGLFTVQEPTWSKVRKSISSVFSTVKLRALHDLKLTKSKELVKRIAIDLEKKNDMELRSLYSDYTSDVIGVSAFGVHCDATLTSKSPIRTVTLEFMKFDFIRGWAWTSIFFWPELVKIFRFTFFPKPTVDYFRQVFKSIVAGAGEPGSEAAVLGALLKMKRDAEAKNEKMDDDLMVAQGAILLQGGFDTSAVAMTFMTCELAHNPEAQEKLYREILEAKQQLGDKDFDAQILSELPYFNSIIKEVLRYYPPLGWLDRRAINDYKVDDKLTIPAGTTVYVNAIGMHFDPEYFPDPYRFIPERFLPENEKKMTPHTFMPFGDGPKICIGWRFAYRTIWYGMAALILAYEFRPKPNSKPPSQIEIEKKSMLYMPGEPVHVDFVPRK